jgi:exopolysaccharide biosynthesis operon protein EpsL
MRAHFHDRGVLMGRATCNWCLRHQRLLLMGMGLLATGGPAMADVDDALRLEVGGGYRREGNLFRLPEGSGGGEHVTVATLGAHWHREYSLQSLALDATVARHRYDRFGFLDHDTQDIRGRWGWQITPRFTGTLRIDRRQALASFADFRSTTARNLRTAEERALEGDWWLGGSWHLLGGAREQRVRNGLTYRAEDDYNSSGGEAGLRYQASSGASLSLLARASQGTYGRPADLATLLARHFEQEDVELRGNWPLGGKSQLSGRVARIDRRHEETPQRDYAGTAGRMDYAWNPEGRLSLAVGLARDIVSYQDSRSSYHVSDSLALTPQWRINAKMLLAGRLEHGWRSYRGAPAAGGVGREDQSQRLQLGIEWTVLRGLVLHGNLERERRQSDDDAFDYRSSSASISALWSF